MLVPVPFFIALCFFEAPVGMKQVYNRYAKTALQPILMQRLSVR